MKVLHLLDHSLPIQSGYAFRSAAILQALQRKGIENAVLTSPKHDSRETETANGIEYRRAWREPLGDGVAGQLQCVTQSRSALRDMIASARPDLIHAHSPCLNGLAAARLGVPLVYEIRSSWEDAAVSSGKTREGSLRYRLSAWLETYAARRADHVVVLCKGLNDEFRRRGIAGEKLTVVGNAIERTTFRRPDADKVAALRSRYGLEGKEVLGFFGSFFSWEGLDDLVRALPAIRSKNDRVELLLAGGGEQAPMLVGLAQEQGVAGHVHFAGRIDHSDIADYYALADMMVFPRRAIRIAEMVTPLKPLEAMHFGCLVVASDVGGHRELIDDGRTGILFPPDDPQRLADAVLAALDDEERSEGIRHRASRYLDAERSWDRMAERYLRIYEQVTRPRGGRAIAR